MNELKSSNNPVSKVNNGDSGVGTEGTEADTIKRTTKLHRLLSELGYQNCSVSKESIDLVEQLFNDLLQFANSFKQSHEQLVQVTSERDYYHTKIREFDETSKYFETSVKEFAKERDQLLNRIVQLESECKRKDEEVFKLHQWMSKVDHDRDTIHNESNSLAHKSQRLEREIHEKDKNLAQMKERLTAASDIHSALTQQLQDKDKEIFTLRKQNERILVEKAQALHDKDCLITQLNNSKDDLSSVVKENQLLKDDLFKLRIDRDTLRNSVKDSSNKFMVAEQLVVAKEKEKQDADMKYHQLLQEFNQLDAALRNVQEDGADQLEKLKIADETQAKLEDYIAELENENNKYVTHLQAFETQVEGLTRTLSASQQAFHTLQLEKADLVKELLTSNELQLQMQRTIETLHVQLAGYGKEIEDLKGTVRGLDNTRQLALAKLEEEMQNTRKLEELLKMEHLKNFSNKELEHTLEKQTEAVKLLEHDNARLKNYAKKYENELHKAEARLAQLQARSPPSLNESSILNAASISTTVM